MPGLKITRIFTGDDGRSHFEDLEFTPTRPVLEAGAPAAAPGSLPVTIANFHGNYPQLPPNVRSERHGAPRRQILLVLGGEFEFECADGTRRFGPGEMVFTDDREGEGHTSRPLGDLQLLQLRLAPEFDIAEWQATLSGSD